MKMRAVFHGLLLAALPALTVPDGTSAQARIQLPTLAAKSESSFGFQDEEIVDGKEQRIAAESQLLDELNSAPAPRELADEAEVVSIPDEPIENPRATTAFGRIKEVREQPVAVTQIPAVSNTTLSSKPRSASSGLARVREATQALEADLDSLRNENNKLRTEIRSEKSRYRALQQQLEQEQNQLMIAETEVDRLSALLRGRGISLPSAGSTDVRPAVEPLGNTPASGGTRREAPRAAPRQELNAQPRGAAALAAKSAPQQSTEMLVGTVVSDKANLRAGPGKDNSPLMAVARGTRLAIETRSGEWFRVIAPNGARAWVSAEVLSFDGGDSQGSIRHEPAKPTPKRAPAASSFETIEDEAFEIINSSAAQ